MFLCQFFLELLSHPLHPCQELLFEMWPLAFLGNCFHSLTAFVQRDVEARHGFFPMLLRYELKQWAGAASAASVTDTEQPTEAALPKVLNLQLQ